MMSFNFMNKKANPKRIGLKSVTPVGFKPTTARAEI